VAQDPQSMSAIRGARGDRPVVILGGDAFRGLIVDLDLPNSRVAFHDATGADAPLGAIELPLIQNSQLRTIPVSIENAEPAQFSVDTGYNGVIQISPAFARAHQLPGTRPASAVKVQEIGGEVLESITTLRRIAIAGVILKDTPVELPPVWMIGDRIDGMLGLTILQRFRVILDFSHDRLWLVPSRDEIYAPFWRERLGISTADGGGNIRITRIYPHSPAALAGLRPGDVIVRVNGYRASSENYIAAASGPAGAHVRLALSDGTERDIALADFY